MRINNNISAMNTYSRLNSANNAKSGSLAKLSSGLRINKAGDDAAGLAISEKMRGQVGGLKQATRNAQDGISLIQTAEGGLNETHSILNRMRELAVQSSSDTNTNDDRKEIQKEMDQLSLEISRISKDTEFNTQNLLGGKFEAKFHIGANEGQNLELKIEDMSSAALGVEGNNGLVQKGVQGTKTLVETNSALVGAAEGDKYQVQSLGQKQTVGGIADVQYALRDKDDNIVGVSTDGKSYSLVASDQTLTNNLKDVTMGTAVVINVAEDFTSIKSGTIEITDATAGALKIKADATLADKPRLAAGDYTVVDATKVALPTGQNLALVDGNGKVAGYGKTDGTWVDTNGEDLFGAGVTVALAKDNEVTVGGSGIDVSSQSSADKAITVIDEAISKVSAERSKLGATQNRLDHVINNLTATAENLTEAESRIRDVDMAEEMMAFTKNNILSQAATSMLAQANQMPQSVLQLLQ